jgi:hypothetical protein
MNTRHCLKLASRIHAALLAELGQGVDAQRMVADPLYARDVLLVCDTFRDGDPALLAGRFRAAALAAEDDGGGSSVHRVSGFSASRFFSSFFGPVSTIEDPADAPQPRKRSWAGRARETEK